MSIQITKVGGYTWKRTNRHFIPGHIWLTHRCHKQEFLLRDLEVERCLRMVILDSIGFRPADKQRLYRAIVTIFCRPTGHGIHQYFSHIVRDVKIERR